MMELSIKNLGLIEKANLEIKDLTILCGRNNTFKTQLTYFVYLLFRKFAKNISIDLQEQIDELDKNSSTKINLQEKIDNELNKILSPLGQFVDEFPNLMASKKELFKKLSFSLNLNDVKHDYSQEIKGEIRNRNDELLLSIIKDKDAEIVEINSSKWNDDFVDMIKDSLQQALSMILIPRVFIFTAERTAATVFKSDLNLSSKNFVDIMKLSA